MPPVMITIVMPSAMTATKVKLRVMLNGGEGIGLVLEIFSATWPIFHLKAHLNTAPMASITRTGTPQSVMNKDGDSGCARIHSCRR